MLTPAPTSLPRSLIFGDLGGKPQLFIGLGDGSLVIYDVDPSTGAQNEGGGGGGAEARTISLGTTSVQLGRLVSTDGERSIFASCDRPAVLHDDHGRLSYSAVNLKVSHRIARRPDDVWLTGNLLSQKNVTACAYLNTPTMPASLVLATRSSLIIGRINEMKKVHIDTVRSSSMTLRAHIDLASLAAVQFWSRQPLSHHTSPVSPRLRCRLRQDPQRRARIRIARVQL
jgi:hypothetical protein